MKKLTLSPLNQRIYDIIVERFDGNVSAMARELGFLQHTVNYYIRDNKMPSTQFITALLERFPDISPSWLLLGKETPKTHIELSSNLGSGTIQDRLNYIVSKECDGNISELARKIGIRQSTISPYFKDKTPSLEFLMAIFKNFPYVTADWLLLGLDDKRKVVIENNNDSLISMANTVAELTRELIECRKKIAELKEQIYNKKAQ